MVFTRKGIGEKLTFDNIRFLLAQEEIAIPVRKALLAQALTDKKSESRRKFFTEAFFAPTRKENFTKKNRSFKKTYGEPLIQNNIGNYVKKINKATPCMIKKIDIMNKAFGNKQETYYYVNFGGPPNFFFRNYIYSSIEKLPRIVIDRLRKDECVGPEYIQAWIDSLPPHYKKLNKIIFEEIQKKQGKEYSIIELKKRFYHETLGNFNSCYYLPTLWNLEKGTHSGLPWYHGYSAILRHYEKNFNQIFQYLEDVPFEKLGLPSFEKQKEEFFAYLEEAAKEECHYVKICVEGKKKRINMIKNLF
jgi:hypothetical protein